MNSIADNLEKIRSRLPLKVQLIAVSKTKSPGLIMEAYKAGQRLFAENYVQELIEKKDLLPNDIEWHFIGHLQSNKVKYIAPFIHCIHSVDSLSLLKEINKQAAKNNRIITVLLQVFIAEEETKFGLDENELRRIADEINSTSLQHISIIGLMGMASFTDDNKKVRSEFRYLHHLFTELKQEPFLENEYFQHLSMGMSSDWEIALEEGSTLLRLGSSIFGTR
ncbi:MAG: YggS family pyridoxal phosphate-dependent enzyme [Crocinitomicaceae bacterium]|nr:YggS family pyridoxal phosphate-dependent enzyme [Crocinitomicaceae bacterium]